MNEYIYKSFSDKFEGYKLRHELLGDIKYPNDINYAVLDPTNINGHVELRYVQNSYDNFERNPYLQNMNPNIRIPYCNRLAAARTKDEAVAVELSAGNVWNGP
jgi:hypothetical protein